MFKKLILFFSILFLFQTTELFAQPLSLVYPKNDYVTDTTHIRFEWNKLNGATSYNLEIATDNLFTTIIANHTGITNTFLNDTFTLNQVIWWRVQAFDGNTNPWSSCNKLSIINPKYFSGLDIWYSSDTGVVVSGSNVTSWQDLSGNNNHAVQANSTQQPIIVPNLLNGKPAIRFDGVNDFDFMAFSELSAIRSVFILFKHKTGSAGPYNGNNYQAILGHPSAHDFIGSYLTPLFLSSSTVPNLTNGLLFLNGNSETVYTIQKPSSYSILSIITAGNLSAQYITNDRNGYGYWDGDYIELILYHDSLNEIDRTLIEKYLDYKYAGDPVNLGKDFTENTICNKILDAGSRFVSFLWSTGATTQTINADTAGIYSVAVTDIFGYVSKDTVIVYWDTPNVSVNDTTFCQNSSVNITTGLGANYSYNWSTLETTENISINVGGTYSVTVTDTLGCSAVDTFIVTENTFATTASLGPDKAICDGDFIGLVSGNSQAAYYQWSDFTNGPAIQINTANTYSLTVTSIDGCVALDSIYVTIKGPLPVPDFFADSACIGNPTHFYNNSTIPPPDSIVSLLWDFGEPGSGINNSSTLTNPTHTYAQAGTYFVHLTATSDTGCVKTISKEITVYSLPVVNFSPVNGCTGVPIQFEDLSTNAYGNITGWQWNFGDASPPSTNQNPTHNYNTAGTYQVTLTVYTEANCINFISKTVTIRESLQPDFSYTSVCFGNPVFFTDLTPTDPWSEINEWLWTFDDGDSSNTVNPVHVFDTAGTYQVSLRVRSLNGCRISITKSVIVNANPIADFTFSTICQNIDHPFTDNSSVQNDTIAHWEWTFDSFGTSNLQNPIFAFPDTGSFNVTLVVSSDDGCSENVTRTVQVYPVPVANFSFDPEFGVAPLLVHFTDESMGGSSWNWNFDYQSQSIDSKNPTFVYNANGIYHVQLITTNTYGCPDTIVKDVRVIPSSVDIGVNTVYASKTSDFLSIAVDMTNYGTRKIDTVFLDAFVDGGNVFRETFVGIINPGAMQHYSFASQLAISNQNPQFVCITASLPVSDHETNFINNDSCFTFSEEFLCMDPFPNPANNLLNIYFILPFDDPIDITLFDSKGSKINSIYSGTGTEGLNRITYNLLNLSNGIYAYKVVFRDKSVVKKFVKY